MSLLLPNLDDKPFGRIVEEARALIPSTAPEWTDHNVHDPGITFIELFAWLAEIQHFRLNHTAAASYLRFFSLMDLKPFGPRPAEVTVAFEFSSLANGVFVPAHTRIWAIGNESLPFATTRDLYLTAAKLKKVITITGAQEVVQTSAEENEVGHYEAFGLSPKVGDALQLEFENWFSEPQGHLTIVLFEDDLPPGTPFTAGTRGFESSAQLSWEYRVGTAGDQLQQWEKLDVIEDGTLNFSRSGTLIFRSPRAAGAGVPKQFRAVVSGGGYEIPPRIVRIQTNTISARQVETIVNEDLKEGLGTADQIVRLKKYPLLIADAEDNGAFQIGDVLDWDALIDRLRRPTELYPAPIDETVTYIATIVRKSAGDVFKAVGPLQDEQKYALAQAFDSLISQRDFYQRRKFPNVRLTDEFLDQSRDRRCQSRGYLRRFNRFLLQSVFPDLFISDRVEIQTGSPAQSVQDEPKTWHNWQQVEHFLESGPADRHYMLDAEAGTIRFGNGLNGKVPATNELIRARFYRYSRLATGNLPAGQLWMLGLNLPPNTQVGERKNLAAASGGRVRETLEETKARSREVFHKQTAILTAGDYESLALNTPGLRVARAKVLPNFNPTLAKLKLPGDVTVVVVPAPSPRAAFPDAPPPEPSPGFLKTVKQQLESRRLVTTNVHAIGPKYVEVRVRGRVFLKKRASETQARQTINRALKEFLDPVFGGPDKGKGWPFGRSVFTSEVSQQLAKLPEVDYVTEVALNDLAVGASLRLPYNGLPAPARTPHAIDLVPFEVRGQDAGPCKGGDRCG
jgi:hypothetical protein